MNREQIEHVSKALADETRLSVLEAICSREEMNCSELVTQFGFTPATISHHLKILADSQLIETRREGQFVYNRVIRETLEEYARAVSSLGCGKRRGT